MLNGGAISWKSGRQDTSTSEAEHVAAILCDQDVLYLLEEISDFAIPDWSTSTAVYEDNMACIALPDNSVHHKYSRASWRP